jgi:DNA-binding LacI/PurR family transcriptional regulator
MMAMGVLTAAAHLQIQVPQQFSVIGVDGITMGQYTSPALTTVGKDLVALGAQAADLLICRIKNQATSGNLKVITESELIVRQSTRQLSA